MTVVGSAEVVAKANTKSFERELRAGTEPSIRNLQAELDKIGARHVTARVEVKSSGIDKVDRDAKSAGHSIDDLIKKTDFLGGTMKLLKPAALIAGLGLATELMSAAAAGGVALGAALAPAAGSYVAIASGLVAVKGGLALAKFGLDNASSATEQFTKALALPTPAMNAFKAHLASLVPEVVHLRNIAQGPILRGLSDGLDSAKKNMGVLNPIVRGSANAIGDLAKRSGELLGSGGFGKDLATVGARNTQIIGILGGAALHLVDAFRNVIVTAGPLTMWMTRLAGSWASGIDDASKMGRETGTLSKMFEHTRETMSHLFSIAGSLAKAFWNIGKAAFPLGSELLGSIDKTAAHFAKWTSSAEGKNKIAEYFADARAPLYELGKLIRDAGNAFVKIGGQNSGGLAKMISQIRTEFLPVLVRVVSSTTAAFGPKLISMVTAFAQAFEPLMGSSSALGFYVDILTGFAKAAGWIIRTVPGAGAAINALLVAMAVSKAAGFAASITGVTKAIGVMTSGTALSTAIMVTHKVAMIASAAATRVLTAAQVALDVAMDANPIGLVVIGLAALAAGIIYAYKHSEKFRAVVNAVFKALKVAVTTTINFVSEHWKTIIEVMLGPFGLVLAGVLKWRKQIVGAFNGLVNGVTDAVSAVVHVVKTLPGDILGFFEGLPGKMLHIGENIVKGLINGIKHMLGSVVDAAKGLANAIPGPIKDLLGVFSPSRVMHEVGRNVGQGLADGLLASADAVTSAAKKGLVDPLHSATSGLAVSYSAASAGSYTARSAGSGTYTKSDLEALWIRAGGSARMANVAASIALAESGGRANATNRNRDGSIDRGLWQINSVHGSQSTTDPLANARAAVAISKAGRDFSAWVAYTTGAYRKFLEQAASPGSASRSSGRSAPATPDVTAWARAAIGHFAESAGPNRGPELDKLQATFHTQAAAWCAEFATTAAMMGGANKAVRTASVMTIKQWAEAGTHGYEKGLKKTGRAGDVVMLQGSEGPFSHTGFVVSVNRARGTFVTAEGNHGGKNHGAVQYVTHRMSDSEGFARPVYAAGRGSGGGFAGIAGATGQTVVSPAERRRATEATIRAEKAALDVKVRDEKAALAKRIKVEELAVRSGTAAEQWAAKQRVAEQRATLHATIILQRAALAAQTANQRAALADSSKTSKAEAAKQTKNQKAGSSELNTMLTAIHSGSLADLNTALATVQVDGLNKTVAALRKTHNAAMGRLADELVKVHKEALRKQHDAQKVADDQERAAAAAAAADAAAAAGQAAADAAAAAGQAAADAAAAAADQASAADQAAAAAITNAARLASDVSAAAAQAIQDQTKVMLDRQAESGKSGVELLAAQAQTALDAMTQAYNAQIAAAQYTIDANVNASAAQQAQDAANLALIMGNAQIAEAQAQANLDLANAAANASTSTPIGGPGLPASSTQPIFHITVNGSGATAVDIVSEISWALQTGAIAMSAATP